MVLDGQLEPLVLCVVLVEETNWKMGKLGDKVDMLNCMGQCTDTLLVPAPSMIEPHGPLPWPVLHESR